MGRARRIIGICLPAGTSLHFDGMFFEVRCPDPYAEFEYILEAPEPLPPISVPKRKRDYVSERLLQREVLSATTRPITYRRHPVQRGK